MLLSRHLALLDIGARDGLQWPWRDIANIDPIMVEPDPEEAKRLRGKVINAALWSEQKSLQLHVTKSPGASSVFKPNRAFLDQFPESDRFDIVRSIQMNATTIDALRLDNIDFIKIDTQGSELEILRGGQNTLQQVMGIEVEVEFAPMYEGQPLFSDIDSYLRAQGFELWDIRRTHWKYKAGISSSTVKGRLIFGDALYLRPCADMFTEEKRLMLATAAAAYGFDDYAHALGFQRKRKSFRPLRNGSWPLFILLDALAKAFRPTHNSWATGGETLGARRRGPFWC